MVCYLLNHHFSILAPYFSRSVRLEWAGYAIATSSLAASIHPSFINPYGLGPGGWYTPPWMFVVAEIAVMLPRAVRGHQWYLTRFGEQYPPGRKAVIPFLL